ncbi:hypothetical protein ScPMuIL_005726 [Solemya velum]
MPTYFQRPENALKRANEFIDVGKKQRALDALYDVIKSKKHRTWQKIHEPIMEKYLELCVELRKSHIAKEGLYQYKNICQQVNIKSLEDVVRKYIALAEQKTEAARLESHQSVIDIDDLDMPDSPESLLLKAVSGEDTQDRTDRAILTPWVKFLWESYRQCLDLLRNNSRVEKLYQDIAQQAFKFCLKYSRKTEFRKLCENLRTHLGHIHKHQHQQTAINLNNPESQALHLETRLVQLDSAINMELWQEAFKAVEDIHGLIGLSKKPPKPSLMSNYYQKLGMVFWKSGNELFHASTLHRLFHLSREQRKNLSPDELQRMASRVLCATLAVAIPPSKNSIGELLQTNESSMEKKRRLATLLMLQNPPTRQGLIKDLVKYSVIQYVNPELQNLYRWLEEEFHPLHLYSRVRSSIDFITNSDDLSQYIPAMENILITRILKQVSQVYQTINFSRLSELIPFASMFRLERVIVNTAKTLELQVRIDHRKQILTFGTYLAGAQREDIPEGPYIQSMPSEDIRNQLTRMAIAMDKAIDIIKPQDHKVQQEDLKAQIINNYKMTAKKEHQRVLLRRQIIEDRKEQLEHLNDQREREEIEQLEEQKKKAYEAEMARLEREAKERERQRKLEEHKEIQKRHAMERLEQLKKTDIGAKMLQNIDEDELVELDYDEIMAKQVEQLEKEKRELLERLKNQERKVDHFARAKRLEEIPLLKLQYEKDSVEDHKFWDQCELERIAKMEGDRKMALETMNRFLRMKQDKEEFLGKLREERKQIYQEKIADYEKNFAVEKKKRLQDRKERRREEKRQKYINEKEEAEQKARDEALKKEREDKEAEEQERRETEEREYLERQAKFDEQANKQRQRELEIEQRLAKQDERRDFSYEKLLGPASLASTSEEVDKDCAIQASAPAPQSSQPRIRTVLHVQSQDAYKKLLKTAYLLAVDGQPLSAFKTLVKVQKENGVQLISKCDDVKSARKFIEVIANVIREKIAIIVSSATAFSILSDGSQARKTGSEKELIFIRVVREGIPVFLCAALQNIDTFGDADANNLKLSIDGAFGNVEKVTIAGDKYTNLLVSATADGASVNTGIYNGLSAKLRDDGRPWLLGIHCISHRVELALKDSISQTFGDVKDFMTTVYYLFKQSGKFKRHFQATASAFNVHCLNFPKVHGTRFINHMRRGITHLLNNWVVLIHAIENSLANSKERAVSAKLRGLLKKLKDFSFLSKCCLYKDVLEACSVLSLQFEKENIMCYDILPMLERTQEALEELDNEKAGLNCEILLQKSALVLEKKSDCWHLESCLLEAGHHRKKKENREFVTVDYKGMNCRDLDSAEKVIDKLRSTVISNIKTCLESRFSSFQSELYKNMFWVDPANWGDTIREIEAMKSLADHFSETLKMNNFDIAKITSEWKEFKRMVKYYMNGVNAKDLWERVLLHRRKEFKDVCMLVEIVLCIGPSNSVVESGFSHLTCMLTDRRLSLNHSTMENLLLIKVNDFVWTQEEKEQILETALSKYTSTKRKRVIETNTPESAKRWKPNTDSENDNLDDDNGQIDERDLFSSDENEMVDDIVFEELVADESSFNIHDCKFRDSEGDTWRRGGDRDTDRERAEESSEQRPWKPVVKEGGWREREKQREDSWKPQRRPMDDEPHKAAESRSTDDNDGPRDAWRDRDSQRERGGWRDRVAHQDDDREAWRDRGSSKDDSRHNDRDREGWRDDRAKDDKSRDDGGSRSWRSRTSTEDRNDWRSKGGVGRDDRFGDRESGRGTFRDDKWGDRDGGRGTQNRDRWGDREGGRGPPNREDRWGDRDGGRRPPARDDRWSDREGGRGPPSRDDRWSDREGGRGPPSRDDRWSDREGGRGPLSRDDTGPAAREDRDGGRGISRGDSWRDSRDTGSSRDDFRRGPPRDRWSDRDGERPRGNLREDSYRDQRIEGSWKSRDEHAREPDDGWRRGLSIYTPKEGEDEGWTTVRH